MPGTYKHSVSVGLLTVMTMMSLLPDRKISILIMDSYVLISYVLAEETSVWLLCAYTVKKIHITSSGFLALKVPVSWGRSRKRKSHRDLCWTQRNFVQWLLSPWLEGCASRAGIILFTFPSSQLFPNGSISVLRLSSSSHGEPNDSWSSVVSENKTEHSDQPIYNFITYQLFCVTFVWGKTLLYMRNLVLEN